MTCPIKPGPNASKLLLLSMGSMSPQGPAHLYDTSLSYHQHVAKQRPNSKSVPVCALLPHVAQTGWYWKLKALAPELGLQANSQQELGAY